MSKDTFPSVLAVSGGQDLLRLRFLRNVVETQRAAGWDVVEIDGEDALAVRDALDGGGGLFDQAKTLAVVSNPNKVNLDLLQAHHEAKDYETTLLLHIEGEPDGRTKFGKFVKKTLIKVHKGFSKPDEWEEPEVATAFVIEEAKLHGYTIRPALARALVDRVGTDLGMLSFEMQKMALLAQATGAKAIDKEEVKGGMAPIAEAAVGPIIEALAARNRKRLSKALDRVRRTSKYDPTMRVCRFLGSTVLKWVQAAHLENLPPKAAATELGLNPWYFENKILPPARRWGKQGTVQLATDLAASERAVLNGAVSPWAVLSTRLLAAC